MTSALDDNPVTKTHVPSDQELNNFSNPLDAFDAYSNGDTIKESVRDRINEHMEARGLSKTEWQGSYNDIPPDGLNLGKG